MLWKSWSLLKYAFDLFGRLRGDYLQMFYLHCEVDTLTKRFSHQSQHCSLLKRQINLLRNYTLCTTEGNDEQMPISLAYFSHLWMQVLYTFWVMGLQQFSMTEVASLENPLFVNLFSISRMLEVEVSVEDASSRDGLAGTGDWFWTAVLRAPWSAASSAAATTTALATWELWLLLTRCLSTPAAPLSGLHWTAERHRSQVLSTTERMHRPPETPDLL